MLRENVLAGIAITILLAVVVGGQVGTARALTYPVPAPVPTEVTLNQCRKCRWSVEFQQFRCKWCWLVPVTPTVAK